MEQNKKSIGYLEIFKNAWKITWSNRYLWWFGLFLAIANAGGSMHYGFDEKKKDFNAEQKVFEFISHNMAWVIAGALVCLVLFLVFVILGNIARGALIDSIEKHRKGEASNFKTGFGQGKKYFWKIFSINVSLSLFIFSSLLVLGAPVAFLFINKNYLIGSLIALLAVIIIIPLIILTAFMRIYGYLYLVIGKLSFWSSLERAYYLFRKNIGSSIIMGLLFIPVSIALLIITVAIVIPIAIVFLIIGIVLFLIAGKVGAIVVAVLAGLVFLVTMIFLKSFYEVFAQSAWIFFFHEIAKVEKEEVVAEVEVEAVPSVKAMPVIESREE